MCDTSLTAKVKFIQKQFLCCVPVNNIQWLNIFDDFKWEDQQTLITYTVNSELTLKYPVKISYQISFLKFIIKQLEEKDSEIHDDIYTVFGRVVALVDSSECFKHYFLENEKIITLKENPNIISEGTTGLCSWQASIALSEWCLAHKSLFINKTILELGSGVGLTGITIALNCEPKKIYLTDYHESVLQVLSSNVALNTRSVINQPTKTIEVLKLPWEEVTKETCKFSNPDLLLAADVIYDSSLFPSLINALSCFLRRQNTKELIIACTVRNENTLEEFLSRIVNQGLTYQNLDLAPQKNFIWSTESSIRIYSVKMEH